MIGLKGWLKNIIYNSGVKIMADGISGR